MKNKRVFIFLCIILSVFLTGCINARELDQLGISLVMGLDIENGKILLTAEIVDPSYTTESVSAVQGSSVKYVQGTGNTIFEALRDITLKFDRRIYRAHNKVLIFGEEIAKRGLVTHMDELFRNREQRESSYVLIAKGAKAYEVMGVSNSLESIPADYILDMIENVKYNPKAININIIDFLKHYYHTGHHPIAGVIEKIKRNDITEGQESTGTPGYELTIIGSAVFREDKLIGYLDGNETKSLNFIMNNIKGSIITFPIHLPSQGAQSDLHNQNLSSVIVIKSKTKNDVEIKGDRLVLKTKINLKTSLGELGGEIDISKDGNLAKIEEACSATVKENIKAAVKKVQNEYGIDIFGFGLIFHRKYPKQWEEIKDNWDEVFSDADFEIEVETHIIRTGLINKAPTIE